MEKRYGFESQRFAVFVKKHIYAGMKAYASHRCLKSVMEQVFYLFTPESTIKTGFEKITHKQVGGEVNRQGLLKIAICLLISMWLGAMISRLG